MAPAPLYIEKVEEQLAPTAPNSTEETSTSQGVWRTCSWDSSSMSPEKAHASKSSPGSVGCDSSTESGPSASDISDSELPTSLLSSTSSDDVHTPPSTPNRSNRSVSVAPAGTTTYTVALLLQLRAAFAATLGSVSPLGYHTERRPSAANVAPTTTVRVAAPVAAKRSPAEQPAGATSWVAYQRLRRQKRDGDDLIFLRGVRSALNKLTVERFEAIYESILSLGIRSPTHVAIIVREIFEKATVQHSFVEMYADLCARLEAEPVIRDALAAGACEAGDEAADEKDASEETSRRRSITSFRHALVNQCQALFEEMLIRTPDADLATTQALSLEELEEQRLRVKQRALGNIKLVAKLLVSGMLSTKLLLRLSEELLRHHDSCADALECLAVLLSAAAGPFDLNASWPLRPQLAAIFKEVERLVVDRAVAPRLRFLLRDVLELRAAGWKDSRAATTQALSPTKLDGLRKENEVAPQTSQSQRQSQHSGSFTSATWRSTRTGAGNDRNAAAVIAKPAAKPAEVPFQPALFQRKVWTALRSLASDGDVDKAVAEVRRQEVPLEQQAVEYANILTRVLEEPLAVNRRSYLRFAARLVQQGAGLNRVGAFSREACLEGLESFFLDTFDDLSEEVPDLAAVASHELMPELFLTLSREAVAACVPPCVLRA
eukprot:TRINITY_DN45428_c0_g1_i1.p1 TRINITY_DN45428_c0_g1~~TRINITY_DN45428_c0_g1_i1.p1  ORF type:complete len:662 (+),score=145.18 TRINITY_DN45428_c0_g1_i1:125-2110(+)